MKAERALPILVYCDAAITIVSMAVNRALYEFLPAPLLGFLRQDGAASAGAGGVVLSGLWMAVNAATLLAWIGLLNLWRPARAIYLWTWVATLLLPPFESAWVFSPVGYLLDSAATIVGGALLGLLYFSDAWPRFEPAACGAPGTNEAGT